VGEKGQKSYATGLEQSDQKHGWIKPPIQNPSSLTMATRKKVLLKIIILGDSAENQET